MGRLAGVLARGTGHVTLPSAETGGMGAEFHMSATAVHRASPQCSSGSWVAEACDTTTTINARHDQKRPDVSLKRLVVELDPLGVMGSPCAISREGLAQEPDAPKRPLCGS